MCLEFFLKSSKEGVVVVVCSLLLLSELEVG